MDEHGEYTEKTRARNILTLEERVRAIREFDRIPIYQKVADIMNCSAKQIRNIVVNRESILLYYASKTGNCHEQQVPQQNDREQKIELLNRVMFEWIQRTQSRENIGRISTKLIRTIALDVKNHLKVPSFYPNNVWLDNFMESYDFTEEDLMSQTIYLRSGESKEHLSLKISDIVSDVSQMNAGSFKKVNKSKKSLGAESHTDNSLNSFMFENSSSEMPDELDDVRVEVEKADYDEYEYYSRPAAKKRKVAVTKEKTIDSYDDALRHLKPLEDFVLLEENFRAIGVISQLEAIFKNPG